MLAVTIEIYLGVWGGLFGYMVIFPKRLGSLPMGVREGEGVEIAEGDQNEAPAGVRGGLFGSAHIFKGGPKYERIPSYFKGGVQNISGSPHI